MPAWNKFDCFSQDLGRKVHNLNSDTLKIMLSDTLPVRTNTVDGNITEIAAAHGYSAGGYTVGSIAYSQTAGLSKLTGDAITIAASGGDIGPFRYAVLYNATAGSASNRPLIAWADFEGEITVVSGDSKAVGFPASTGILQVL